MHIPYGERTADKINLYLVGFMLLINETKHPLKVFVRLFIKNWWLFYLLVEIVNLSGIRHVLYKLICYEKINNLMVASLNGVLQECL